MAQIKSLYDEQFISDMVELIESNSINFLLGAGFSAPLLGTLGNVEKIMEIIKKDRNNKYVALESILYLKFFEECIYPIEQHANKTDLKAQIEFVNMIKQILNKRESATLHKQVNIFTTNYDVFLELAFEEANIEYNDGFVGRIMPYFSTAHYNMIFEKQVLFTDRVTEIPVVNLFKIHGSITWKKYNDSKFSYGDYKQSLNEFNTQAHELVDTKKETIREMWKKIKDTKWDEVNGSFVEELLENFNVEESEMNNIWKPLTKMYQESFKIVNPTKEKFSDTLLDKNYYELLRMYSNELEKTNAILIVFGFSFADEHIQEITLRALNNPSLIMIIFAYQVKDINAYMDKFHLLNNVWIITLKQEGNEGVIEEEDSCEEGKTEEIEVACAEEENTCVEQEVKLDLMQLNKFLSSSILSKKMGKTRGDGYGYRNT